MSFNRNSRSNGNGRSDHGGPPDEDRETAELRRRIFAQHRPAREAIRAWVGEYNRRNKCLPSFSEVFDAFQNHPDVPEPTERRIRWHIEILTRETREAVQLFGVPSIMGMLYSQAIDGDLKAAEMFLKYADKLEGRDLQRLMGVADGASVAILRMPTVSLPEQGLIKQATIADFEVGIDT